MAGTLRDTALALTRMAVTAEVVAGKKIYDHVFILLVFVLEFWQWAERGNRVISAYPTQRFLLINFGR